MMGLPHLFAFAMGFLSLSQEILWTRVTSVALGSPPYAFALVLVLYLLGIAMGARHGRQICASIADVVDPRRALELAAARVLLVAAVVDVAAPAAYGLLGGTFLGLAATSLLIVATALLKSILFPLVHQLGTSRESGRVGRSFALVYCANILGATGGPLITGFVLLDYLSTQQCLLLSGVASAALAGLLFARSAPARSLNMATAAALLLAVAGVGSACLVPEVMYTLSRERARGNDYAHTGPVRVVHLIENSHGVIETIADPLHGDVVLGNGVYDGRINTDVVLNSNNLERLLVLAALKPEPRRVLVIGLSGGAWVETARSFPGIEHIDVVEINPGYLDLVGRYAAVRPLLNDQRIRFHIDDARRWLKRNAGTYDLIVMNTSVHWRAFATNVLSVEFQSLVRSRLNPGGVATYNATGSPDAVKTSAAVFPWVRQYVNFVYVSDRDPAVGPMRIERALAGLSRDGRRLFDTDNPRHRERMAEFAAIPFRSLAEIESGRNRALTVITDNNMLTEYRYGRTALWSRLFGR